MGNRDSHQTGDPMTTHPRRHIHSTNPRAKGDLSGVCYITSITCTSNGSLVMADTKNRTIKVVPTSMPRKSSIDKDDSLCNYLTLGEPHPPRYSDEATRCLVLIEQPSDLATLPDGEVAVTTDANILYFLSAHVQIVVTARVETQRRYTGVAALTNNTLVVSSCQDLEKNLDACVDVLDRGGHVLRTLVDGGGGSSDWLRSPTCLCLHDADLYLADYYNHVVHKVRAETGQLLETLTHPDMRTPRQICADKAGNLLVASEFGQCVLVRAPSGQWRTLLTPHHHSRHSFDYPSGVCLTDDGGLVVAWTKNTHQGFESELVGYQL